MDKILKYLDQFHQQVLIVFFKLQYVYTYTWANFLHGIEKS